MTAKAITRNEFDVCARKHGGNQQSRNAWKTAQPSASAQRRAIYDTLRAAGDDGMTAKEYAETIGKPLHAISGRFSELRNDGWIERTEIVRDGAAAWRAKP